MAKNKNRERKQPQSQRGRQEAQQPSLETQSEPHLAQPTPGDSAHKGRKKRFGHN
ncbi:hypothetical protein [Streptomyces sp. NPDC002566]|uniref:hypothetical protein n=1 Tax=Streptomyces sp. NPDC002566 TaxID=3364650 RepID=UPI0036755F3D